MSRRYPHSSHWGVFEAQVHAGEVAAVHPRASDTDPSPLLGNLPGSVHHRARVTAPVVRAGWLDDGPGPDARRGPGDGGDLAGVSDQQVARLHPRIVPRPALEAPPAPTAQDDPPASR